MSSATVVKGYSMTIPQEIREATGIAEGDRVCVMAVKGNKIVMEKASEDP